MNFPHITSRVNGMKIPLQRGQAGIMHRFTQPENKLIISKVDEHGSKTVEPERMVIASDTTDDGTVIQQAPAQDNDAALQEAQSAAAQAIQEAEAMRAELDALRAQQAAAATPKGKGGKTAKAAEAAPVAPAAETAPAVEVPAAPAIETPAVL